MKYHFEKPTISKESLQEQIDKVRRLLAEQKQREAEQWYDTVPDSTEAQARAELKRITEKNHDFKT